MSSLSIRTRAQALAPYLAAALVVSAAAVIGKLAEPRLNGAVPMMLFTLAVLVAAGRIGWGPGLVATGLAMAVELISAPRPEALGGPIAARDLAVAALFGCVGVAISFLSNQLRRTRESSATRAAEMTEELYQLRSMLECTTDRLVLLDRSWRIVFINARTQKQVGEDRRLLGENIWAVFPEAVGTIFDRELRRAMEEGSPVTFEGFYPPWGTWHEVHAHPTPRLGLAVSFRNITERRREVDALRESEQRFRMLVEAVQKYALYMLDDQGRVTSWNRGAERITGWTESDVLGRPSAIFYPPEDIAAGKPDRDLGLARLEGRFAEEGRRVRKDGTSFLAQVTISAIRNDAGEFRGYAKITRDVTEYRAAEEALQESEARYRAIVETAADAIVVIDERGIVQSLNRAAEATLGYPPEELVGRSVGQLMPPEHEGRHDGYLADYRRTGVARIIGIGREIVARRKDGTFVPLEIAVGEWRTGDDRFFGAIMRDITERRRSDAALRDSEQRFREITENIREVFWAVDPGTLDNLYESPAFEEVWGRPRWHGPGSVSSWAEGIHPDDRERVVGRLAERAVLGTYDETYRVVRPDGSTRWVWDRAYPVKNEEGVVHRVVGVAEDITERRQAEEELQRKTAALEALTKTLELAPVFIRDLDGTIRYWNEGSRELYGFSQDEAIGRSAHDLLRTQLPQPVSDINEVLVRDGQWRGELQHTRKDGSHVEAASLWVIHRDAEAGDLYGVIEVNADITERKRADRALQELNRTLESRIQERTRRLEASVGELNAFAYSVSHDLRAPLRGIEGFANALIEDAGPTLDATAKRYAERIAAAARRMDQLIEDLLAYSRLTQVDVAMVPVDVDHTLNRILADLQAPIDEGHVIVEVARPLPSVLANPTMLEQVLSNLLTNAIKFVPPGGAARVFVRADRGDKTVRLTVEDNGIGIPEEHQPRIFEIFERLHGSATYPGTGIGLAIVRKALERMGGRTGVKSKPGAGSQFWVELRSAPPQH